MAARPVLSPWSDGMNVFDVVPGFRLWPCEEPPSQWQAHWIVFPSIRDLEDDLPRFPNPHGKPSSGGAWMARHVAGRFICYRRLPAGPTYKLSQWKQLEPNCSILWHPEPTDRDVSRAENSAAYLRANGLGRFDVEHRADGTLWIKRVA